MRYLLFLLITALCGLAIGQVDPTPGLLKPGIRVQVSCEEEPSLNREYVITADGLLVLSFIGAVEVGGLNEVQAASKISDKLVKERIVKKATVTLKILDGSGLPVRFTGAVKLSGETPYRIGMKLSDVIAVAAPTEAADLTTISITDINGKVVIIDASDLTKIDPELRAGDRVDFPLRTRPKEVYLLGGVLRPGTITYEEEMTVQMALEKSGGVTANGDRANIVLERNGEAARTLTVADLATVVLEAGDRLRIPIIEARYVSVEGGVAHPGAVRYTDGMTLSQAINSAGGAIKGAKLNKVKVISSVGKPSYYDVEKIDKGMMGDIALQVGDRIEITKPSRRSPNLLQAVGGVILGLLIFGNP